MRHFLLIFTFSLACSIQANEKVYLHLDQNAYFLGETMWFCAYVNDTKTNRPTELSRVLYVELVAPEGNVVKTVICKVEKGKGAGSFELEKGLLSGLFEVRAYTRYMCNWIDNYYSRVVPIFDAVKEGNYESRTMYNRRRATMTKKELKEYRQSFDEAKAKTAEVRKRMTKNVNPLVLTVDTLPIDLNPQQKVVLKFHGEPNCSFSLSIKDGSSDVFTNYRGNITDDLINNTDWIVAEALSAQAKRVPHFVQPEKGITLRGQMMRRRDYADLNNWQFMKGVPNASIALNFESLNYSYEPLTLKTDSAGWFQVSLGNLNEDGMATLRPSYDSKNPRAIRLDKWFSPNVHDYHDSVYAIVDAWKNNKSKVCYTETDGIALEEVNVKGKRPNYGWQEMVHSLMHINIQEECEWMIDNDESCAEAYAEKGTRGLDFEATMLEHYCYANAGYKYSYAYRSIYMDSPYQGDSIVPDCKYITDVLWGRYWDYKEAVIRTDRDICEKYRMSKYGPETLRSNRNDRGNSECEWLFTGKFIGNGNRLASKSCPSLIVCYVPYTPDEKREQYENKDPRQRYTKVHGFTPRKDFVVRGENRRTLFWNSNVATDENGDATVEFQNNSTCRELHISAEGITQDGRPIEYKNH